MSYPRKPGSSNRMRRSRGISRSRSASNVRSEYRSVFYNRLRISRSRNIDELRRMNIFEESTVPEIDIPSTSEGATDQPDIGLPTINEEDPNDIRQMEMDDLLESIQMEMASMELSDDSPPPPQSKVTVACQTDDQEPSTSKKTKY